MNVGSAVMVTHSPHLHLFPLLQLLQPADGLHKPSACWVLFCRHGLNPSTGTTPLPEVEMSGCSLTSCRHRLLPIIKHSASLLEAAGGQRSKVKMFHFHPHSFLFTILRRCLGTKDGLSSSRYAIALGNPADDLGAISPSAAR